VRANGWAIDGLVIDRGERLREQILTGALPEGTRLPPERALADRLGVNRSTVVHGYRELVADGLIDQRVGSGSRVAALTVGQTERVAGVPWWITLPPWRVGQFPAVLGELAAAEHGDLIAFVQGVPPAEPSPLADLAASFARVGGDVNYVLTYGDSEGYGPLREAVAERMQRRGCAVDARDVLMLTGSTQGITLVAQSLAEPGDEIVVEAPTYPGALQIFQIHGLRAIQVPVDDDGIRVDHIEAVLRTRRPRFIYTMPSLHNPTGVTMSDDRRERLVALARRWGVPIVEDDPYGELASPPLPPLAARDSEFVIYLSSFSKTIAPSLRLGWMVAPRTIYDRLLLRKQSYDMATSTYIQAGVGDYVARHYDGHLVALRAELAARRSIANAAIARFWPAATRVAPRADGY
jgi:DNA-binding transcriptional MocR family regulator